MDKPFGEWNSFHIKMIGERVTVMFNGEVVVNNAVLENFFANRKAGYQAYGKVAPKEGGRQGSQWLDGGSGLCQRPDPAPNARQRDPLEECVHPRNPCG
jgi:hypothetical protein